MPAHDRSNELDHFEPSAIIAKKRDGGTLTPQEIARFVARYVSGDIPDYQMSAMAMAITIRGMDALETAALTELMLNSGTTLQWDAATTGCVVDKHSTGGIGDKVSLVLAPLLACCGLRVPMLSGRGLGITGGTLDKLESIPGYRTDLSVSEIQQLTQQVGCVISGTTEDLVPADRKLYALRDATATVPSIPLITASIMSKKMAEKLDALVLDVKVGKGAFMKSPEEARELAISLVEIGRHLNLKISALLTDMNQPLGRMIGNALEVNEAVDALRGDSPPDLLEVVLALGSELLMVTGTAATVEDATAKLHAELDSGRALDKFQQMVAAQGGDLNAERSLSTCRELRSERAGYVQSIDNEKLGRTIIQMGGGRTRMGQSIDHSVGLEMLVKLGQPIDAGETIMRVFAPQAVAERVAAPLARTVLIGDRPPEVTAQLVLETIVP